MNSRRFSFAMMLPFSSLKSWSMSVQKRYQSRPGFAFFDGGERKPLRVELEIHLENPALIDSDRVGIMRSQLLEAERRETLIGKRACRRAKHQLLAEPQMRLEL